MGEEVFIDANIFLVIFFDDAKASECEKLLYNRTCFFR